MTIGDGGDPLLKRVILALLIDLVFFLGKGGCLEIIMELCELIE